MEAILSKLTSIGGFLALAGVLSSVLYFIDYNLRILMWIDLWGPIVGWLIRGGAIVLGLVFLVLGFVFAPKTAQ